MDVWKILILIFCLTAVTEQVGACACGSSNLSDRDEAAKEFEESKVVFSGEVISVKELEGVSKMGAAEFTFSVIQSFKGPKQPRVQVLSTMEHTDCAFHLEAGNKLFVYAVEGKDGKLYIEACTRTSSLEHAAADFRFARGEPPSAEDLVPYGEKFRVEYDPTLKVRGATLSGVVHWPEHVAVGEAFVTIWEVDDQGRRLSSTVTTQKADADGKYEIRYLDPGKYFVSVADSRLRQTSRYVGIIGLISLPEGTRVTNEDVTLHSEPLGTVRIHVIAPEIPREKLFVVLRDVELDLETPGSSPFSSYGTTAELDSSGVATFKWVPYGNYNVSVGLYEEDLSRPSWTHDDASVTLDSADAERSVRMHRNTSE
jgi:hypothetical protein